MIKEWKIALAEMSRHKDDLVHIKDMYRLLRFKGEVFRSKLKLVHNTFNTASYRVSISRNERSFCCCISTFSGIINELFNCILALHID
jgi:hypothetical protein